MKKETDLFEEMKEKILEMDPCYWCSKYLNIDGKPFNILNNGWKPFVEIYRYMGVQSLNESSKPTILCKGRQVGASVLALFIELFLTASGMFGKNGKPPIRLMHCFPQAEIAMRFSKTKLNPTIAASKPIQVGNKLKPTPFLETRFDPNISTKDSLSFKQFEGGSHIFVEYTGLDGARLRGLTLDGILFDEIQLMNSESINTILKSLTAAQYGNRGIQLFFGTPLAKGSAFHKMWLASSQKYYHLRCLPEDKGGCDKLYPLYVPESDSWMQTWVDDDLPNDHPDHGLLVKCMHCGKTDNKHQATMRGEWVACNPDQDCKYEGFHVSQLLIPYFKRWDIMNQHPTKHETNTMRLFENEVIGSFYQGGSTPITFEEISAKCGDRNLGFSKSISPGEGKAVYLGLDWGNKIDLDQSEGITNASVGQSYCTAVVMVENKNKLEIVYCEKFKRTDPTYKQERVLALQRAYSCNLICADIGHANDLSYVLRERLGDKFIPCRSAGHMIKKFKYQADLYPPEIIFDSQYMFSVAFDMLKKGVISLPYKNYELCAWLVNHASSMDIKISQDRAGNFKTKYVKGSMPNDGLLAIIYCLIARHYQKSSGFTIIDPKEYKDILVPEKPLALAAYIPHRR